jgi:hypothetical protein
MSLVLLGFRNFLTGHGVPFVPGSHAHANYKLYVRLVDKALRRYEGGRDHLEQAFNRPSDSTAIDHVVRALSDLEDCFHAVHRALRLLARLKTAPEAPVTSKDLLPFDDRAIRKIRNASEHVDDALATGEIGTNEDIMHRVWADGVSFTGESISYVTLAMWLRRLHEIARALVDHDSLAGQRPTAIHVTTD